MSRAWPRALVAALIVGATSIGAAASAHDVDGTMDVYASKQVGADTIRLEVAVPYTNDGDLATEAVVVADLAGPDGARIDAVPLEPTGEATYVADVVVPVPGTWLVELRSSDPVAATTVEVVIEARATEDGGSDSTTEPSDDPGAAEDTDDPTSAGDDEVVPAPDTDGSGTSATPIVAAVIALAALVGFVVLRRRRTSPPGGSA